MAIKMRRGNYADLDKSKLVAGEIVVATDNAHNYVGVAKAPNDVLDLATQDDLQNMILEKGVVTVVDECLIFKPEGNA